MMAAEPKQLPIRLRDENRTATWNPALTRAAHVLVHVRDENDKLDVRRSLNSGRARVRAGEWIERIVEVEA